jgi:hypothetical protein
MREYELIIDNALRKGLFPSVSIPMNDEWLLGCLGFRIGRHDLEGYELAHEDPLTGLLDMHYSWPFPQWLSGERYNFLIVRDSTVDMQDEVYVVSDNYIVTHIFDVDRLTFNLGTLMEVADFGDYAIMVNGVIIIYWDVGIDDWHEIRSSDTVPMMATICNFKGQAFGGNVKGIWNVATEVYDEWEGCDETFYVWSKIGEMDFVPDEKNTSGYRRDPYGGEVYHVKRLGDAVIGYSSKGVVMFKPSGVTFECIELDDVGLLNQGAMDGNLRRHVYVGADYILREVTSEGVKELGYYYFMDDLYNGDIIVNYDRNKKDFYISNGEQTYLLSPYGMSEVPQHPSAVWVDMRHKDELVMLPITIEDPGDYTPSLITTVFDMNYRGEKTVFSVESDALVTWKPLASVGWMNTLFVWGYTDDVPMNNQGIAPIIITGNEFMVQLKFTYVARIAPIKYIIVRYKMTDMRGIRGVHAPPLRGQR